MLRVQRNRLVAAALLLVLALFALPIVTNQPSSAPTAPTTQTQPTAPPPTATPAYQPGTVVLGVGERTCALTSADDRTSLTLSDGCEDVAARLRLPASGTIWLSLTISDQPDLWLPLDVIVGDPAPPELDQRGRFFGCTQDGEQVCQVKVEINAATYQVAIPLAPEAALSQ